MRSSTIFVIIGLVCTLSLIATKEQGMPFAFHSKDKALNYKDDLYSTKEELLNKFAASLSSKNLENGSKAIVINIKTPSSFVETINFIKEQSKYLPQLTNLIQSYFRTQVIYDASNFVQELQNTLQKSNILVEINSESKPNQVSLEETEVTLDDISMIEQTVKQAFEKADKEDASVFVLFTQSDFSAKKPRVLQGGVDSAATGPSMLQIPRETLFALILLFILFLPVLYIGISCLYGIEAPEKFATQNLVVGREY